MDCTKTMAQCMSLHALGEIALRSGENPPREGIGNFTRGFNLFGGWNMRGSYFDSSNIFQS